jgi:bifunctional pyridoxal-dependent enzyme with beta-cystathionase and maltose regulon repressor activities
MHVTKHNDLVFKISFQDLFGIVDLGMKNLRWLTPSAIQIDSKHIASIISSHYSVWVKHGYDFEDELLSHVLSFFGL